MVRRALVVLCLGFMTVLLAGCGQTYELQSISVTPSQPNIEGINSPSPGLQLVVTAHFSNGKTEDVTTKSTYQISQATALTDPETPLDALTVNKSGVLQTTPVPACTWGDQLEAVGGTTYSYWITSPYVVNITYSDFTTTASVSVDSLAPGCYDGTGFVAPTPVASTTPSSSVARER
jgi:hypothetical protein